MDTEFSLMIEDESEALAASAAQACFDRLDALELLLTKFNDTSDVAVIRSLAPGQTATVARETIDLLVVCAKVCAATLRIVFSRPAALFRLMVMMDSIIRVFLI